MTHVKIETKKTARNLRRKEHAREFVIIAAGVATILTTSYITYKMTTRNQRTYDVTVDEDGNRMLHLYNAKLEDGTTHDLYELPIRRVTTDA